MVGKWAFVGIFVVMAIVGGRVMYRTDVGMPYPSHHWAIIAGGCLSCALVIAIFA